DQNQVIEVHCVVRLERAVVVHVDAGGGLLLGRLGLLQCLFGGDQVVLPGGDLCLDALDTVVAPVVLVHQVGNQGLGSALVEGGGSGCAAQALALLADDVQAQVVEGGDGQAPAFGAAQQHADALPHLPGGLVGEGHSDDVLG